MLNQANRNPSVLGAGSAIGGIAGAQTQQSRSGSLADAVSSLNDEMTRLEEQLKLHFERMQPLLDTSAPANTQGPDQPPRPASPLAAGIFEYVARLRSVRQGLQEITERISY